jgi:phage shock protein PspC (stress-responsive transcriptional regulator)
MKTVTTIHLNGRAYQVEDDAHKALAAYLEKASAALADDPDKDEIVADFEQAIAEKFAKYLNEKKNVVTLAEIEAIINEMGPVGRATKNEDGAEKEKQPSDGASAPKRLYRIREGRMIAGVCNGIAAYLNVDVTVVRIMFVVVAIISQGAGLLAYIVLMMIIPAADTDEKKAHATGSPFTAQAFFEQAKKNYAEYKVDGNNWKRQHREQKKYWKYKAEEVRRQSRKETVWSEAIVGMAWIGGLIALTILAYRYMPFFHFNLDRLGHWITLQFK